MGRRTLYGDVFDFHFHYILFIGNCKEIFVCETYLFYDNIAVNVTNFHPLVLYKLLDSLTFWGKGLKIGEHFGIIKWKSERGCCYDSRTFFVNIKAK